MRQTSRSWKAKFGPALVLALVACSVTYAQDVRTNYMPGTDFSKYHTYAWDALPTSAKTDRSAANTTARQQGSKPGMKRETDENSSAL
jgi:hypothetical protein